LRKGNLILNIKNTKKLEINKRRIPEQQTTPPRSPPRTSEIIIIIIMLTDPIPGDRNVIKKEDEKILKYKDLTIEIKRMLNVKTMVIPIIIGATGTVSKSFRKYASNKQGKHEVKKLHKTAILGTAHKHTSESTNVKVQ